MGIGTTLRSLLVCVLVGLVGYGLWWVDRRLETLTTLNRAAQTLERLARQENGDLRLEARRLSERLTQAQTTTSMRTGALNGALASLQIDAVLRKELEAQLRLKTAERLGETVGQITVRDTITVPVVGDIPEIRTDWLDASLIGGVFAYEFRGAFHYLHVSHLERNGAVRIIESAYLQSQRNPTVRQFIPVASTFTIRKPTSRGIAWDPTLHLGVGLPAPKPILALSLVSYGITRQGQDVLLSGPMVGITIARMPDLVISPVALNVGRWIPVLDDVFVTGGFAGKPGQWGVRMLISTSL